MDSNTYKNILSGYIPEEEGDFFLKYRINGMQYIVYSAEPLKISCMELCNFNDITKKELSLFINNFALSDEDKPVDDEFRFEQVCGREQLLQYLFDMEGEFDTRLYQSHVSGYEGVVLYGKLDKLKNTVRNLYEIRSDFESGLLFDNSLSYSMYSKDEAIDRAHICFDPLIYKKLLEDGGVKGRIYCLASSSAYILSQAILPGRQSCLYVGNDYRESLEALIFHYHLTAGEGGKAEISFYSDRGQVAVTFSESFEFERLVNLGTSANRYLRDMTGKNALKNMYDLRTHQGKATFIFRCSDLIMKAFMVAFSRFIGFTGLII